MAHQTPALEVISPERAKYKRGQHPNSRKNLEAYIFKKGENGNHGKGYSLTATLRHMAEKPLKPVGEEATAREQLAYSTLKGAIEREPTPFNMAWERLEGKVMEQHALVGALVIKVVYEDRSKQIAGT